MEAIPQKESVSALSPHLSPGAALNELTARMQMQSIHAAVNSFSL